ncbi:unnamed protein product, partial [Ixodes pacificus]
EYKLRIPQTGTPHVVSIFFRFTHFQRTRLATRENPSQVDTNVRRHTMKQLQERRRTSSKSGHAASQVRNTPIEATLSEKRQEREPEWRTTERETSRRVLPQPHPTRDRGVVRRAGSPMRPSRGPTRSEK